VAPANAPNKGWSAPRTPWGEPDLQGIYSNRTITPFERPDTVGGREFYTPEEIATLEKAAEERSVDNDRQVGTRQDVALAYNQFWWDRGTKMTTTRTSLVIDPPDGRVPPLTDEGRKRAAQPPPIDRGTPSWVDRSLFERCITRGMPGAMSPSAYNNTTASPRVRATSSSKSRCSAARA
jgi:hypothetical protein